MGFKMETSKELVIVEKANALSVFSEDDGLAPFLSKIRAELDLFVPDVSTKKGRDEIASIAFKVSKSKAYLDGVGKDLVADLKELPKKIDASRKAMRETLDSWRDDVRKPLTDWEKAEEARLFGHASALSALSSLAANLQGACSADIQARLADVKAIELGDHWQEFALKAAEAKDRAIADITAALDACIKNEAAQAELARLREEAEARAQNDRDEAIARDAAEKVRAEMAAEAEKVRAEAAAAAAAAEAAAERAREDAQAAASAAAEKARADAERAKVDAERVEMGLRLAAEKAEREKLEAQQRADKAVRDAKAMAELAAQNERNRQADEQAEADRQLKEREKNKAHKAAINNAAKMAFIAGGMTEDVATMAVKLIAKGLIPAITINY